MILHFYFARRFLLSFLMITAVIGALVMLVDGVDQARRFANDDVSAAQVLGMTLLHLPETLNMVLPLIMILATVALFLSLARSSELVVTRAAGRSALRALIAPVAVALVIGVLAVAMLNPIVAATSERAEQLTQSYRNDGRSALSVSDEGLWLRQGDTQGQSVIRAWRTNHDGSVLYNVTIISYAPDEGPVRRIEAETARLVEGNWRLRGAKVWPLETGLNAEGAAEEHESITLPTSLTAERIRESIGRPAAVSIYALPEFIRQLEQAGFSTRQHEVWLQAELARPFFLVAMVLVASAFTMRHTRFGGTGIAVLATILLGFGLYFIRSFAQILGENGQIPVVLAAWAPPAAAIFLALGLLLHAEDG